MFVLTTCSRALRYRSDDSGRRSGIGSRSKGLSGGTPMLPLGDARAALRDPALDQPLDNKLFLTPDREGLYYDCSHI